MILPDDAACQCFSSASTVAISSFSILPTGMPVQPEITSPTICASTQTRISGVSPCSAQARLQFCSCSRSSSRIAAARVRRLPLCQFCCRGAAEPEPRGGGRVGGGACRLARLFQLARGSRGSRAPVRFSFSQRSCSSAVALCGLALLFGNLGEPLRVIGAHCRFALENALPARPGRRSGGARLRWPAAWRSAPAPGARTPCRAR